MVRQANNFFKTAEATTENGRKGCHIVGSTDFVATFVPPVGSTETAVR
jgi:hypothetical protein